ncbi:MAG: M28 family peptidase [Akkermansiaceae bacterium]|nr:M28 family peptidase [Armatimonadota bacterium]
MLLSKTLCTLLAASAVLLGGCSNAAGGSASLPAPPVASAAPSASPAVAAPSGFDKTRSFADLQTQVNFGPRYSGSEGYPKMRDWLAKTLTEAAGVPAKKQDFTAKPGDKTLAMSNVYAHINPDAKTQVLLCAHYDTRPTADEEIDPAKQKQAIPGANDGASGVAVLLEMARLLKAKPPTCGVQIVFFDGEDYGPGEAEMYLGAKAWAKSLPLPKPTYAILIDMIGDKSLQIYREQSSESFAPEINDKVWNAASSLNMSSFQNTVKYAISDDHIPLQAVGIKAIDLIDFDYGPWHTLDDTVAQCSPDSLRSVGDVLAKVIYDEK